MLKETFERVDAAKIAKEALQSARVARAELIEDHKWFPNDPLKYRILLFGLDGKRLGFAATSAK